MNTLTLKTIARRSLSLVGVASVAAMVLPGVAAAAPTGQLTVRSATFSTSKVNATAGVVISVKAAVTGTITGVKVSFCAETPFGTCTHVTGLSASSVTLTGQTGFSGLGSPVDTTDTVTLSGGTASVAAGATATLTLAGLVNPSGYQTFYVNVLTQTGAAVDHDYGSIGVSTAKAITVTADVAESLIFRVANTITACNGTSETNIADPNDAASDLVTLSPNPMTTSGASTGTAQFCVVSNAQNGYAVTYADWGLNSYDLHAGFWNGSHEFPGTRSATVATPGTEEFGFNVQVAGSGTGTVTAPYNSTTNFSYLDTGAATQIASATGATIANIFTLSYSADVSATTPGGTYRAHQMFVCTATF